MNATQTYAPYMALRGIGLTPLQISQLKRGVDDLVSDGHNPSVVTQLISEGQIGRTKDGKYALALPGFGAVVDDYRRNGPIPTTVDDAVEAEKPADYQRRAVKKSFRGVGKAAAGIALAVGFGGAANKAEAVPIWEKVNESVSDPYYHPDLGETVRRFQIQARNNSTEGEELKEFQYPAGTNNDIIYGHLDGDFDQDKWVLDLGSDPNWGILTALGGYNILPGNTATFDWFSTDLTALSQDYAKGLDRFDVDFTPDLLVNVPKAEEPVVPEPGSLEVLALGLAGLLGRKRRTDGVNSTLRP